MPQFLSAIILKGIQGQTSSLPPRLKQSTLSILKLNDVFIVYEIVA